MKDNDILTHFFWSTFNLLSQSPLDHLFIFFFFLIKKLISLVAKSLSPSYGIKDMLMWL